VTLVRAAVVAAAIAALVASSALADSTTPAMPAASPAPVVTTAVPQAGAQRTAAQSRATFHVQTTFPAAGQLLVTGVAARTTPSPQASVIKVMHQFRPDYRIQEILAVSTRTGTDGKPWYKISIPMRPNGTMGWIPARSVKLAATAGQIVVHRSSRTIDLYWHNKLALQAKVAVGRAGMETPNGHFYVAARFVPFKDPFLGVFAVETSAYSKLTEWPGGGVVGIHGTNAPQLLGQAVSHGCVRVANSTAAALVKLAPLGTPILITD
jgi:lipoprotein-anchoring transpeptidase ErfK/SrfK